MTQQIILPTSHRAPSMSRIQAIGYENEGRLEVEYLILDTDTGQSNESGELLTKYFCQKKVEFTSKDLTIGIMSQRITNLTLYVNEKGDAYRTWKGKLKGNPVCNFLKGEVYKYTRYKRIS